MKKIRKKEEQKLLHNKAKDFDKCPIAPHFLTSIVSLFTCPIVQIYHYLSVPMFSSVLSN